MTQDIQVAPVATNTPFEYNENLTISVGVSDMEAKIERAMRRADKVQAKQLKADTAQIEADATAAGGSGQG